MFPTRSNGDPGVSGFPKSKNFRGVSSDASDAMRKKAVPEVQPPVLFPLSEKRTGTVTWTEGRPTHSAPEAFPIRITVEVYMQVWEDEIAGLAARSAIIERDGGGSATLALPCLALPCLAPRRGPPTLTPDQCRAGPVLKSHRPQTSPMHRSTDGRSPTASVGATVRTRDRA